MGDWPGIRILEVLGRGSGRRRRKESPWINEFSKYPWMGERIRRRYLWGISQLRRGERWSQTHTPSLRQQCSKNRPHPRGG